MRWSHKEVEMATFNDGRWQEEIERLRVLLNDVEHGAWAFARYNDVSVKNRSQTSLARPFCAVLALQPAEHP